MTREDLEVGVRRLRDRLSYVLLYAPEFPKEDDTTVEKEFDLLLKEVELLWNSIQDVERRRWLDLMSRELSEARGAFLRGDPTAGSVLVEAAEERLANWRSSKQMKATFVVDSSGGVRSTDD